MRTYNRRLGASLSLCLQRVQRALKTLDIRESWKVINEHHGDHGCYFNVALLCP